MHLELVKGLVFYHVNIVAANGETVFTSETFYSKGNAQRAAAKASSQLKIPVKAPK